MSDSNHFVLSASIAEAKPLRFTPAGLPAIDLRLAHKSRMSEAGQEREVRAELRAVAFGAMAERLVRQPIGSAWVFRGFIATPRNGKQPVLHIQEMQQD